MSQASCLPLSFLTNYNLTPKLSFLSNYESSCDLAPTHSSHILANHPASVGPDVAKLACSARAHLSNVRNLNTALGGHNF